jgi:hypothetical protein
MVLAYDIFRKDGGQVMWVCEAATLAEAEAKVRELTKAENVEFVIFQSRNTGEYYSQTSTGTSITAARKSDEQLTLAPAGDQQATMQRGIQALAAMCFTASLAKHRQQS